VDNLTGSQRMAVAKISGAAELLTIGRYRATPLDRAVAQLRAISGDPVVLGTALGNVLYRVETESTGYQVTADLLRVAGADEDTAAATLAWQRERAARSDGGFRL
jgi:hypothetical protein